MSLLKISIKLLAGLFLIIYLMGDSVNQTSAQESVRQEHNSFVYIVQPGDTLITIALHYNVNLADIILANSLSNFNLIFPGQHLTLPGVSAPNAPQSKPAPVGFEPTHIVQAGETLFNIANAYGVSMDTIITANHLVNPDLLQTGQSLQIPRCLPPPPEILPAPFSTIDLSEPTIIHGRTLVVRVKLSAAAALSGNFEDRPLFFIDAGNGQYWSITAIHALTEPNIYPIKLRATFPDGAQVTISKDVNVVNGPYRQENIQLDDQRGELLNPDLIRIEQERLDSLWSQVSPQPRWMEPFRYPITFDSLRITSNFGTRRSYNSILVDTFHSGTDFGGDIGTPIYAPAAGSVVLAERLAVRGNAVLIDHGLGLFTGYWHQTRLAVAVGQEVKPGDLIGFLGDTGMVTGPHLHWEMRLNGIAVEPLQWVQQTIP
jgi:murein DD-endopeptidase MepM/ murein hydrolase activator NlpD